jgi:Flp pilus assembly protein CpaB
MGKDGSSEYTTVTLEATPQDALNINAVAWWGNIRLLLRSPLDNEIIEIETVNQKTVYAESGGA